MPPSSDRGRGTEEMLGLDLVRVSIDAYLELFEHPTADDRVLMVTWGATFPSQSSIEGMLDADVAGRTKGGRNLIDAGQHDGSIRADIDPAASSRSSSTGCSEASPAFSSPRPSTPT